MNLPFKVPFGKKEITQYFLALLLREEKVTAVIFEEQEGKIKPLSKHEESFKESVETASEDEFLDTLDKAISIAEQNLPKSIETQKTIFGLKETWVEDAKIKRDYLSKLKKACDALGLSPVGFLVIHEAIAHLLQNEEGAPVSAILTEIGKRHEVITLLRGGRIIETHRAKIEDSVTKTTDRLLHHFVNYEVLPSRIVLFDGEKSDELSQEFISHSWSKDLPFLHVPQITVLSEGFDARAVLFGAASQMGFEVLGESVTAKKAEPNLEEEPQETEKAVEEDETSDDKEKEEEDFGFVVGKDVRQVKKTTTVTPETEVPNNQPYPTSLKKALAVGSLFSMVLSNAPRLKLFAKKIKLPIIPFSIPSFKNTSRPFLLIPIVGVLFLILLLWYIFGLSAKVTLLAKSQTVEKNQDVILSSTDPTDPSTNTIHVDFVTVSEDGSSSAPATGKKEIGTNAKGQVKLTSIDPNGDTFPAGTTITASNGLKFTFDNQANIASASAGSSQPTATVNVTASDVGPEYNLPSGINFTISGVSQNIILVKNDNPFSGGTKKNVTVVSKDDLQKANDALIKSVEGKAKTDLMAKIQNDNVLVSGYLDESINKSTPSKNVGDEASSFDVKGTVDFKSALYKKSDGDSVTKTLLTQSVENMTLSQNKTTYSFDSVKPQGTDKLTATLAAKAYLLPKVDNTQIAKDIAGKTFTDAKNIAKQIPQISDIAIKLSPNLPFPHLLPKMSNHIMIEVVGE